MSDLRIDFDTQDLAVFDDAREYLMTIASELVPPVPGRGGNE